jgi:hypothetical protein
LTAILTGAIGIEVTPRLWWERRFEYGLIVPGMENRHSGQVKHDPESRKNLLNNRDVGSKTPYGMPIIFPFVQDCGVRLAKMQFITGVTRAPGADYLSLLR